MKQQIISGLKKKLLLVEIDTTATPVKVHVTFNEDESIKMAAKLIGKLTDITESQFAEWVEDNGLGCFDNYKGIVDNRYTCLTAKESFFSKLEVDGICFSNPLGDFPTKQNTGLDYGMEYISKQASWEEAQEKVWDKERCWLFEIIP